MCPHRMESLINPYFYKIGKPYMKGLIFDLASGEGAGSKINYTESWDPWHTVWLHAFALVTQYIFHVR